MGHGTQARCWYWKVFGVHLPSDLHLHVWQVSPWEVSKPTNHIRCLTPFYFKYLSLHKCKLLFKEKIQVQLGLLSIPTVFLMFVYLYRSWDPCGVYMSVWHRIIILGLPGSVSELHHSGHLRLANSGLWGDFLGTVGYLAASLVSTY